MRDRDHEPFRVLEGLKLEPYEISSERVKIPL